MSILSIQSHVAYGYVGNKAAAYPLQRMGFDVWPVHTVQFSNHTGYDTFGGDILSKEHLNKVFKGLEERRIFEKCQAVLSGYMGSGEVARAVHMFVQKLKEKNSAITFLCDPVLGRQSCYVKPDVLEFFKKGFLSDIITPNKFEAETLSDILIETERDLPKVARVFHNNGIKTVIITGIQLKERREKSCIFLSNKSTSFIIETPFFESSLSVKGRGDLFSAVFLGAFLTLKKELTAAQVAAYHLNEVLLRTKNSEELEVLQSDYSIPPMDRLPPARGL